MAEDTKNRILETALPRRGSISPRVRRSSIWAGSWPVPSRAMPRRRGSEDRDDGACENTYEIRQINKTSPLSNGQRGCLSLSKNTALS